MCKVLAISGIKSAYRTHLEKFAKTMLPYLSEHDNDSVGYAAQTASGLFGERWLNPMSALKPVVTKEEDTEVAKMFKGVLTKEKTSNSFGAISWKDIHALIFHARYATSAKGLKNAHPFVSKDKKTALIHNGIVDPTGLTNLTSTCDSEVILNEYTRRNVSENPSKIKKVTKKLAGYFACAVLTETNNGKYLDLFRDNSSAKLYGTYIKELDAVVFCTEVSIIAKTCSDLGWNMGQVMRVKNNTFIRLDAVTGEVLDAHKIKKKYSVKLTSEPDVSMYEEFLQ